MSDRNKNKRTVICLSSDDGDSEEEEEEEEEEEDDGDDHVDEESSDYGFSEDGIDDVEGEGEEEEDEDESQSDDNGDDDDEESLCNRVICLLNEGRDLGALNLKACKEYLRKHGLRLAGAKVVCIERIKEHWRLKDGNGEALYPKSSFVINCTGDVCQGDVVLFTQKVYKKFDKVTKHGRCLGKRTIAGRVVSDSYGAAKQQHTFTIEIFWSKGINKLPPLFPLLVKGRNLYKLKTFRQHWNNERERLKVLAEKHKRGAEARLFRAMRKTKKTWSANGGTERQKHSHHTKSTRKRKTTEPEKRKHVGFGKLGPQQHAKFDNFHQEAPPTDLNSKQNALLGGSRFSQSWKNSHHLDKNKGPRPQSYTHKQSAFPSQVEFRHRNAPFHFSGYNMGHTSTMIRLPHFGHYSGTYVVPTSQYQGLNHHNDSCHADSNPGYGFELRNLKHSAELPTVDRSSHPFGTEARGQRKNGFQSVSR